MEVRASFNKVEILLLAACQNGQTVLWPETFFILHFLVGKKDRRHRAKVSFDDSIIAAFLVAVVEEVEGILLPMSRKELADDGSVPISEHR